MSDWDLTTFLTTGNIGYFSCGYGNVNFLTCLFSGRLLPSAFIIGGWGLVKMLTLQWGLFSAFDVPPYEGDIEYAANVQTVYYVLDSFAELLWATFEFTFVNSILWIGAILMVVFNVMSGGSAWYAFVGFL